MARISVSQDRQARVAFAGGRAATRPARKRIFQNPPHGYRIRGKDGVLHKSTRPNTLLGFAALLTTPAWTLQASYQSLAPDGTDGYVEAYDVSADGTFVVGRTGNEGFRWSVGGGYERLGALPDPSPASSAGAISADGSIVVGWSNSSVNVATGFRWDAVTGMQPLEPLSYTQPVALSSANAIGHGGQLIGGYSYDADIDQPTIWTSPSTPQLVGIFGPQSWGYVMDIADQAPVVVGGSYGIGTQEGFIWRPATGTVGIGLPPGALASNATAVNAQGEILFGTTTTTSGQQAFRWSTFHGFELLGSPSGASTVRVRACNGAGTVAVGTYQIGTLVTAFYWSEATGLLPLKSLLAARGATGFSSSTRLDPHGLSADGNTIVGVVGSFPTSRWFLAKLSPTDPQELGSDYCLPAAPNSTGFQPTLTAFGSDQMADNDLVLSAADLPPSVFGIVLASRDQDFVPAFLNSSGNLCLGGSIGRFQQAEDVRFSGPYRHLALRVDTTQIAQPGGTVAIQPGETWNFQFWYRDQSAGAPTSNFTSGRSIAFQ